VLDEGNPAVLHELADFVRRHPRLFVLTGAGCSTASGIAEGFMLGPMGRQLGIAAAFHEDFLGGEMGAGVVAEAGDGIGRHHHALIRRGTFQLSKPTEQRFVLFVNVGHACGERIAPLHAVSPSRFMRPV
jgi:hypothetical protein